MPELGPYGSVRGALSNERPYRDLGKCRPKLIPARPMRIVVRAFTPGEFLKEPPHFLEIAAEKGPLDEMHNAVLPHQIAGLALERLLSKQRLG
jgi:hypothetical protein